MRKRPLLLSVVVGLATMLALGACARTFGDAAAEQAEAVGTGPDADAGATSTTKADAGSAPSSQPVRKTTPTDSKAPQPSGPPTVPPGNGFDGDPPSFPDFTFTATRSADGIVTVTGSGCAGGFVQLFPNGSGDALFADPDPSGKWSTSAKIPAGTLKGTCVALGSSGQTHAGGTHTVTVS